MGGQLDQISEAIGELRSSMKTIEKYVHESRHGVNNLSQKLDALAVKIASDITSVEIRFDARLRALEATEQQEAGAKKLVVWFLQSPLVGWIAAGIVVAVTWWKKP